MKARRWARLHTFCLKMRLQVGRDLPGAPFLCGEVGIFGVSERQKPTPTPVFAAEVGMKNAFSPKSYLPGGRFQGAG